MPGMQPYPCENNLSGGFHLSLSSELLRFNHLSSWGFAKCCWFFLSQTYFSIVISQNTKTILSFIIFYISNKWFVVFWTFTPTVIIYLFFFFSFKPRFSTLWPLNDYTLRKYTCIYIYVLFLRLVIRPIPTVFIEQN